MGKTYSSAQRIEFKNYQIQMDKAITDVDSYDNYRKVKDDLQKALLSNAPSVD